MEFRFLKPMQRGSQFLHSALEGMDWPAKSMKFRLKTRPGWAVFSVPEMRGMWNWQKRARKPSGHGSDYDISDVRHKIEVRLNGELVWGTEAATSLKKGCLGLQAEDELHE